MTFTKRIGIERYQGELAKECAGLIEGETEDGQRWIIFMDPNGRPEVYWPERDEDGAVKGSSQRLHPDWEPFMQERRREKMREILSCGTDADIVKRLRESLEFADKQAAGDTTYDAPVDRLKEALIQRFQEYKKRSAPAVAEADTGAAGVSEA